MYKQIAFIISAIIVVYLAINLNFLIASKRIHDLVLINDVNNLEFKNYIQNIASEKIRGCTTGAKIISLGCHDFIFKWSLGEENFNHLQTLILQKQESEPVAKDLFEENQTLEYFQELSNKEKLEQAEIIKNTLQ